jgi:hypothetical protein
MVVFGGYLDNGKVTDEMLTFNFEAEEWTRLQVKNPIGGLAQAACAQIWAETDGSVQKYSRVSL